MRWVSTIGACVLGGALLAGTAAGLAQAATGEPFGTPGSSEYLQRGLEAQSSAASARDQAAALAAKGGQAYKTGQVQRAQAAATIDQANANDNFALAGVPSCQPVTLAVPPSPELAAAQAKVERLKESGGWAYKTGAVQRAEAEARAIAESGQ